MIPIKTPDNRRKKHYKTNKYYWTHSAYVYENQSYKWKVQGHQQEATFNNRIGGSNAYYP